MNGKTCTLIRRYCAVAMRKKFGSKIPKHLPPEGSPDKVRMEWRKMPWPERFKFRQIMRSTIKEFFKKPVVVMDEARAVA